MLHPRQPFLPIWGHSGPLLLRPDNVRLLEVPPVKGREIHQIVLQVGHKPLWHSAINGGAEDAGISRDTVVISPGRKDVERRVFDKAWASENSESVKRKQGSLSFYIGARI
ncbi:hypothetical protein Pyn_10467 [Prunus yedoensis var. nudiflora]|uniref:Uncharacterized protein n=1 Tax=Prunus yedoensis var. nudiflora TaxID=2094558 RepID=A0A315B359_PRUYE|nr:hypothetical protein Pyn_10467 [Prunus yedoensis var. nudiflora]